RLEGGVGSGLPVVARLDPPAGAVLGLYRLPEGFPSLARRRSGGDGVSAGHLRQRPAAPRAPGAGIGAMISGVLLLLASNGASLLGAGLLLKRLKTGESSVYLLLLVILRLLLISAAVLVAGLSNTLNRWGLGLAG